MKRAQQVQYIGFLHRHPYATDAYELGFAPGVREDYRYGTYSVPNVDLPVVVLDNDFHNPDIHRYLEYFEKYDPSVAVLGDAYTPGETEGLNQFATGLKDTYPYKEFVVVPKCARAFSILDEDIVLGYPMGYSDVQAIEYSDLEDWRGRRVHLLGASPPKQYAVIEELTQPLLTGHPPSDIVGLDWTGPQKAAYLGEYWSRTGWKPADHLSIRETVRESLKEIKMFWQKRGVWPSTEPIDLYGPAVDEPDEHIFMDNGGEPIPDREALETAYVATYEEYGSLAFQNKSKKKFIECREGLQKQASG